MRGGKQKIVDHKKKKQLRYGGSVTDGREVSVARYIDGGVGPLWTIVLHPP